MFIDGAHNNDKDLELLTAISISCKFSSRDKHYKSGKMAGHKSLVRRSPDMEDECIYLAVAGPRNEP